MKRISRMLGVTLLEIMLVLAIAAFIVVMSIRFYQSAVTSAYAQDLQNAVATGMATADSIGLAQGSYTGVTTPVIMSSLPSSIVSNAAGGKVKSPWGELTFSFNGTATNYVGTISGPWPQSVCAQIAGFITNTAQAHLASSPVTCSGANGTVTWTYNLQVNAS